MRLIDADEATKQVIENSTDEDRLKLVLSIANCPTIDSKEVKHGKWERLTIDFKKCSICGAKYFTIYANSFNHCPNCGARMDGDENDL